MDYLKFENRVQILTTREDFARYQCYLPSVQFAYREEFLANIINGNSISEALQNAWDKHNADMVIKNKEK